MKEERKPKFSLSQGSVESLGQLPAQPCRTTTGWTLHGIIPLWLPWGTRPVQDALPQNFNCRALFERWFPKIGGFGVIHPVPLLPGKLKDWACWGSQRCFQWYLLSDGFGKSKMVISRPALFLNSEGHISAYHWRLGRIDVPTVSMVRRYALEHEPSDKLINSIL